MYFLIFICYNNAWKYICCTQIAPPPFGKEAMELLFLYWFFFLKKNCYEVLLLFFFGAIFQVNMPVSFLLFLNHLVFVTLYMQVCYTIKCQIDGSLVKVYFFRVCWFQVLDAYFYSLSLFSFSFFFFFFFFGLLTKRLCWGPC